MEEKSRSLGRQRAIARKERARATLGMTTLAWRVLLSRNEAALDVLHATARTPALG